jgi:Rab3 GTPase-activating protein catalytic subunit
MQIPGNVWVEVWQTARPVPARRQKRLFDDTKEAEKVLHFLSSLKPADVVVHLMPMLIHAALLKAMENGKICFWNFHGKKKQNKYLSKAGKI